jgi:DNA polymerase
MLVGEQPGDKEDRAGEPFVGPAGAILDRALDELEVDRGRVYLTNVVKHFRWDASGKRRIHKTPTTEHVRACLPWFEQELAIVDPRVVVCLGAVAARALLGSKFRVLQERGRFATWDKTARILATVHPSSVLRSDDRGAAYSAFVRDLEVAVRAAQAGSLGSTASSSSSNNDPPGARGSTGRSSSLSARSPASSR